MSSSLPDGVILRRGRSDDVDAVTAALIAEEVAVRGESGWGTADTADWWRGLDLQGEAWVAEAENGTMAGILGLFTHGGHFTGWASVHPGFGGDGVGAALVALAEERARQLGGSRLQLGSFAENAAASRLLHRAGYAPVRHHYRMEIELAGPPPPPEWPTGITCARFDLAAARAVHAAISEALADDWGFTPTTFEEWTRIRLESPAFDPTLWFVARGGDDVAGVIRGDRRRWGVGWVGMLGVRRGWRRRGLGLALLRRSFGEFYDRGERRVGLGVDAENPSGATRLYERAGMRVRADNVTWEKALS
jgi:mycothiol synthase